MVLAVVEAMECGGDRFDYLDAATAIYLARANASGLGAAMAWRVCCSYCLGRCHGYQF